MRSNRTTECAGIAFVAGVVIGAAAGIVYAPHSGMVTRRLIDKRVHEVRQKAEKIVDDTKTKAKDIINVTKAKAGS